MRGGIMIKPEGELKVSFGYQCNSNKDSSCEDSDEYETLPELRRNSSFSCLSGAALSANATLANTNICNGLIGAEILPSWDSPNSFRRVPSSPTLSRSEGFLNAMEVQVAGGAAGEDRVQAVCSEENGWLFCAIYDGFNGRDAADFLAGTLYETIVFYFNLLDWESSQESIKASSGLDLDGSLPYIEDDSNTINEERFLPQIYRDRDSSVDNVSKNAPCAKPKICTDSFRHGVLDSLQRALSQAENDFLYMVEQEMEDRPDLVSVGSCVLVVLLHGKDLYTLNLGDSRAVLATYGDGDFMNGSERLKAIQLTDSHTVDDEGERMRVLCDHPDDPMTIVAGRVKGKLKVTRAFGVGYLKKKKLNDALMGILQVRNLLSPPYVSTQPSLNVHRISKSDCFVVVGSDGLFDFFTNDEAVKLVYSYILSNPSGDPAKFLLEQLVVRAANCAGFSMEELMNIPAGRRRKYHDDVTVIVIILGTNQRTTKASTCVLGPQENDPLMIKCVLQISDTCQ
ncbi:PREDICTED: probable protein phosphatase 2C 40 isoform X5 [Prunus mume]|uniref:Probable protein phosphatase 2C 40 isoform X5 n=1 Tax=Prunus mume TaxID=102107 RepID=A0ABM0NDF7_PRUMU|nr:PREDICTED: probable protein phosphatase 2C 40 isoform X5 [Prunus mume]